MNVCQILQDLFYDHAPPSVQKRKRRTHFHAFMLVSRLFL
jgi:predicted ATPase